MPPPCQGDIASKTHFVCHVVEDDGLFGCRSLDVAGCGRQIITTANSSRIFLPARSSRGRRPLPRLESLRSWLPSFRPDRRPLVPPLLEWLSKPLHVATDLTAFRIAQGIPVCVTGLKRLPDVAERIIVVSEIGLGVVVPETGY
jgi:hypothetical protein